MIEEILNNPELLINLVLLAFLFGWFLFFLIAMIKTIKRGYVLVLTRSGRWEKIYPKKHTIAYIVYILVYMTAILLGSEWLFKEISNICRYNLGY
ncbi:MAG: hypothetical protein PHH44_01485 [bacterium]|jgi:hypothetical protein|nr:hypothetical protein [bacterium]